MTILKSEIPKLLGHPDFSHRVETLSWGALCFYKSRGIDRCWEEGWILVSLFLSRTYTRVTSRSRVSQISSI